MAARNGGCTVKAWIYDRFRKASRQQILDHAYALETQLRVVTALLQSRDDQGFETFVSKRAIAAANELMEATAEAPEHTQEIDLVIVAELGELGELAAEIRANVMPQLALADDELDALAAEIRANWR